MFYTGHKCDNWYKNEVGNLELDVQETFLQKVKRE